MKRIIWTCLAAIVMAWPMRAVAADTNPLADLVARVRPSLVAVKYQWDGELAKQELIGCGVVVREDGLVMIPAMMMPERIIPDVQMKDFKIILPGTAEDDTEIDAEFAGRDERADVCFVQAKGDKKWPAIHFEDRPAEIGQTVYGVGLLPKSAGYQPYLTEAKISGFLRGEVPQVLVTGGGLGCVGSAVFDGDFHAIGIVHPQEGAEVWLNQSSDTRRADLAGQIVPPHLFTLAKFYLQSLNDPPSGGHPVQTSWMGVPQMNGLNPQIARFLGLKNQPAVQIGDVIPGTGADKAGLKAGDIITQIDGQPLQRGDAPEELPMIMRRVLIRRPIGDKVTFTVLREKGAPPVKITVALEQRPRSSSLADRYFAKDLGFVAREAVFTDAYQHKMKPDATGVVIDQVRRDGAAATAKVTPDQWVMQLNGQAVTDLKQFRHDYDAFRKDHPHDDVILVVQSPEGVEQTLNIEPPQPDSPSGAGGGLP